MAEEEELTGLFEDDEVCRAVLADYHRHPRHRGTCPDFTAEGSAENELCGDRVRLTLKTGAEKTVECAAFTGAGCAVSQASASLLCERLRGLPADRAMRVIDAGLRLLNGEDADVSLLGNCVVLRVFGGHPARRRCAALAWETARALINPAS